MEVKTHRSANKRLLGVPLRIIDETEAKVELETCKDMAVDEKGLVHGGFTYGLADYAAMLTINHPYVVLANSNSRFVAPVKVGDIMRAHAVLVKKDGARREVKVEVSVGKCIVFTGIFTCYILDDHVLERSSLD
jgi:acyl-coenzyme A thioesterase PaaI-like protein